MKPRSPRSRAPDWAESDLAPEKRRHEVVTVGIDRGVGLGVIGAKPDVAEALVQRARGFARPFSALDGVTPRLLRVIHSEVMVEPGLRENHSYGFDHGCAGQVHNRSIAYARLRVNPRTLWERVA